jgi:hypothetical protein
MLPDLERQYELFPKDAPWTIGRFYGTGYDIQTTRRFLKYASALFVYKDDVGIVPVDLQQTFYQISYVCFRTPDLTRQQVESVNADPHAVSPQ